jgi:hypothetical protein
MATFNSDSYFCFFFSLVAFFLFSTHPTSHHTDSHTTLIFFAAMWSVRSLSQRRKKEAKSKSWRPSLYCCLLHFSYTLTASLVSRLVTMERPKSDPNLEKQQHESCLRMIHNALTKSKKTWHAVILWCMWRITRSSCGVCWCVCTWVVVGLLVVE